MLFEDPARRSTSVGVTVSPVRVASIDQFGDLDAVGRRLLDVERRKVCGPPAQHGLLAAAVRCASHVRASPPKQQQPLPPRIATPALASLPPPPPRPALQESTLGVSLLSSSCRSGGSGALLYEYEYELNSSRGTKRILNTVTITGARPRHAGQGGNDAPGPPACSCGIDEGCRLR